ncbi:SAM-dependent methyltransferase [Bacillus phage JBP901]|uniref:Putative methyltransferase n=1 Tax=Bacillus phage JBP901 TaxID=1498212 RepID=A0A0E3DF45_9CAUD|nr:SAM-dependent methyltransferase [Bacillus phage JBP901]AID17831.1 putative methyltransferase [Bacillus phage JBP901]
MKLDYGSGRQPKQGFKSSDFIGTPCYDYYIKDYKVLDLADNTCDVIHCRNVIHHIPKKDLPILFAEFKRLLKPGGKLIISEPREEFHKQNLILDLIWYRWVNYDTNIMIPYEYVNYKEFLTDFTLLSTADEYNNEILTYEVNKPVRKITRRTGVIVWSSNLKRSLITS